MFNICVTSNRHKLEIVAKQINLNVYRYICQGLIELNPAALSCTHFTGHFSPEYTKTKSLGATESRVWLGNCNVKVGKSTESKLHKIWQSVNFAKN